jgi:hypothetical protein
MRPDSTEEFLRLAASLVLNRDDAAATVAKETVYRGAEVGTLDRLVCPRFG